MLAREVGLPADTWERPVAALDATAQIQVRLARALSFDPAMLLLEHPTALVARADVKPLALRVRTIAERRGVAALTLTADAEFAAAVARRVATWEPATGRLTELNRRRMVQSPPTVTVPSPDRRSYSKHRRIPLQRDFVELSNWTGND